MKKITLMLVLFGCMQTQAQNNKLTPQQTIVNAFQALSERNETNLRELCTPDLIIVEDAKLWNIDTLAGYMKQPVPADYHRQNSFKFLSEITRGNLSSVVYENQAKISGNGKQYLIIWMETAVLIRERKTWRIKTLHSTTKEKRKL